MIYVLPTIFFFFSENPALSMFVLNTIIPLLVEKVTITTLLTTSREVRMLCTVFLRQVFGQIHRQSSAREKTLPTKKGDN